MKRAILAEVLGVAGSVATSYGQGIITFNNYSTTSFQPVIWGAGVPSETAGANVDSASVEVALYYVLGNVSGDTTSAFLTAAGSPVATTFIDPTINTGGSYHGSPTVGTGGPGGYYADSTVPTLAGWTTSQTATFMVAAWDTTGGLTLNNALYAGYSALWTETVDPGYASSANTGYGIVPSTSVAGLFANGPGSVTVSPVPEPTTLALAGLGGAALLALRRKKA